MIAACELAMFALPISIVQYLPSFFFGSLLVWFGVEIVLDWMYRSYYKLSRTGGWGGRVSVCCVDRSLGAAPLELPASRKCLLCLPARLPLPTPALSPPAIPRPAEYGLLWATFGAIMQWGLEAGIAAGIILATLYFAWGYAQVRET